MKFSATPCGNGAQEEGEQSAEWRVILLAEQYKQDLSSQTAGEEMFGSVPEHGVGLPSLALRELASGRVIDSLQQGKPMQDVYLFLLGRSLPASPLLLWLLPSQLFPRVRSEQSRLAPMCALTFVQDGVGRLVAGQRLLAEVLVRLGQAFHLGEASVERHGGVAGVLRHVEVRRPPQLLLDHQRLLQQLQDTEEVK